MDGSAHGQFNIGRFITKKLLYSVIVFNVSFSKVSDTHGDYYQENVHVTVIKTMSKLKFKIKITIKSKSAQNAQNWNHPTQTHGTRANYTHDIVIKSCSYRLGPRQECQTICSSIVVNCTFVTFFEPYFFFGARWLPAVAWRKLAVCIAVFHNSIKNVHMGGWLHRRRDWRCVMPSFADVGSSSYSFCRRFAFVPLCWREQRWPVVMSATW